jgi:hypothetical protein
MLHPLQLNPYRLLLSFPEPYLFTRTSYHLTNILAMAPKTGDTVVGKKENPQSTTTGKEIVENARDAILRHAPEPSRSVNSDAAQPGRCSPHCAPNRYIRLLWQHHMVQRDFGLCIPLCCHQNLLRGFSAFRCKLRSRYGSVVLTSTSTRQAVDCLTKDNGLRARTGICHGDSYTNM